MPTSSRIPPLLQPYVRILKDDSIILLTSTLDATANWLIIRFLCEALNPQKGGEEAGHNILLVSWLREYEFWKQEARKGGGLDLDRCRKENKFAFVNGLSGLFLGNGPQAAEQSKPGAGLENLSQTSTGAAPADPTSRISQAWPARRPPGRIIPAQTPPTATSTQLRRPLQSTNDATRTPKASNTAETGLYTLISAELHHLKSTITNALSSFSASNSERKTLLVFSNPDLMLATNPSITHSSLVSLILTLHNAPSVSHILLQIQSDTPLLSLSSPPQPLEINHHNFLVKCAHMSRRTFGVRVLDTGVARDVSGVLRITFNGGAYGNGVGGFGLVGEGKEGGDEEEEIMGENGRGKEFLYQVKGDGSVRVFERGAGE